MVVATNLYAQPSGKITGTVLDKDDLPVPNMNVTLLGTGNVITTKKDGKFVFTNIHPGTYSIQVSYVGFESQVQLVSVKDVQTTDVSFEIYEKTSELENVEVTERKTTYVEPLSAISTRTTMPMKRKKCKIWCF